ncbi:MAG: 1-acyl-sn-glycerol-3-phosphate acyltransferase [Gemmatimonadota bacterium]|nr:1-acyl-sn-glycerol-3-phosphate acyltransferase [Gemmatimonadota bacterium]
MTAGYPRRGSAVGQRLARGLLRVAGWRVEGLPPALPRFVLIVAPHTSNWDFPVCVLAMFAVRLHISWLGKHSLFRFPVTRLLRWLGGEPVQRGVAQGLVEQAITTFQTRSQWVFGVAPEGTRRPAPDWKTGFLRVAAGAGVPVVPVTLDWSRRVLSILPPVPTTAELDADLLRIRRLYRSSMARRPAGFVEVPAGPMEPGSPPG